MRKLYFVEDLNLISWLFCIFPFVAKEREDGGDAGRVIYYVDASRTGSIIARAMSCLLPFSVQRLDFRMKDIRDEEGVLISDRISYCDLVEVHAGIVKEPYFPRGSVGKMADTRLDRFLSKQVISQDAFGNEEVRKAMVLTRIAAWKAGAEGAAGPNGTVIFLNKRGWSGGIRDYASRYGVVIVFVARRPKNLQDVLLRIFGKYTAYFINIPFWFSGHGIKSFVTRSRFMPDGPSPKLCVEYYGHINLDRPELNSDLFFFRPSGISGGDVLLAFNLPEDPLDREKARELSMYGIRPVALAPKKTANFYPAPIFRYKAGVAKLKGPDIESGHPEAGWFRRQTSYYQVLFDYWRDFFRSTNSRIYLSWFKYNATHCAIADAMQSLGGVTAIYQRSFEEFPSPAVMAASDIVFGFSKSGFERERLSGSSIPYYVVTGYIGDYRFPLLKSNAAALKNRLRQSGARHILAYCDGNSTNDPRWNVGHEFIREQYIFLLEKVLSEPWFGLVLKPKAPGTLRKRLGDVALILKKAEETGRCFVFEGGSILGAYPPAASALAADITVDHLAGATAAMESVLAGVPTLLVDREGWKISRLHRLGHGKVVFEDWDKTWKACVDHWKRPGGIPGFGDWSEIIDDIDPFRDGKAAERIGVYLRWLVDGFKAGLPRKTVMADASERYCRAWGGDKIKAIGQ